MKKILAFILSAIMLFSLTVTPASAVEMGEIKTEVTTVLYKALAVVFEALVKGIALPIKEGANFVKAEDYSFDSLCDGLYDGTDEFITEAPEGAVWSMGSASASLIPEDWESYDDLYLGGYMSTVNGMSNDVRQILDDMKVRVIAMSDGTGRGTAVFATIDSIGLGNPDVAAIREMLGDFAKANNINSINIFTTHTHSGIDTQGLWTDIVGNWPMTFVKGYSGIGEYYGGTSDRYMAFLYERVSAVIKDAVGDMEEGSMTYAEKDFAGKYSYIMNRPSADALDDSMKRFIFTPYSGSTPTLIVNMAAHPSSAGAISDNDKKDTVKGHGISGDYIYYMGQVINGAGYDFMFFNGAICGIYIKSINVKHVERVQVAENYGLEMGKIALGLTMTEKEIMADEYLMSLNFGADKTTGYSYTPWYKSWTPAEETEVAPILNIRIKAVETEITNPVIILAGKLQLVNYLVKKSEGKYFINTEIGYIEIGNSLKVALVPGEFCSDLAYGGSSLTAESSAWKKDFSEKSLSELFGEDILVFGLANDAIGYIVPDNDYLMCVDFGHYHETISLGKNTASTLMKAFAELKEEIA